MRWTGHETRMKELRKAKSQFGNFWTLYKTVKFLIT
jgi:hypothetical protein